ncbi:hypothetical protein SDC9_105937 [bioreactor metagenome]|uniref:IrrE N-terminal-like domain-containing protein n=1 Tax=bioreactor metagenome TaxID=1076179 RepID=A0A645B108_9ZZZZ|nr:ImmA/IrrE family metallo-endopeptidase [Oscillospiraceae bacterium]
MDYDEITEIANELQRKYETRNPFAISRVLNIHVLKRDNFTELKGMYRVIKRSRFIFINSNLNETLQKIVCAHELGHDMLHRDLASKDTLHEYDLYRIENKTELEANVFASELLIDTDELLELIKTGLSAEQLSRAMYTDINLLAIKVRTLIIQGYKFRPLEFKSGFLA